MPYFYKHILVEDIADALVLLDNKFYAMSKTGLNDGNIYAESFYAKLLNLLHGWHLENANDTQMNTAGIDLIDPVNKIVIQVSRDVSSQKIQNSITKYVNHNDADGTYHFLMLCIGRKKLLYTKDFEDYGKVIFDKRKDIWDISDLIEQLKKMDVESLKEIDVFLKKELEIKGWESLIRNPKTSMRIGINGKNLDNIPYVFICYSHKDRERVYPMLCEMHQSGIRFWFDDNINQGVDFDENIENAIDNCKGMVIFISENTMVSEWCVTEIKYALNRKDCKILILPVFLEPTNLRHGLRMRMTSLQALYMYENNTIDDIIYNVECQLPEVCIQYEDKNNALAVSIDIENRQENEERNDAAIEHPTIEETTDNNSDQSTETIVEDTISDREDACISDNYPTVLDIFSGIGGRAIAFQRAGFKIDCLIEWNHQKAELLKNSFGLSSIIEEPLWQLDYGLVPDTDVISADIILQQYTSVHSKLLDPFKNDIGDLNLWIYGLISLKKPKMVLLEAAYGIHNKKEFMQDLLDRYGALGYNIDWRVLENDRYSGYPLGGKKLYIVLQRSDLSEANSNILDLRERAMTPIAYAPSNEIPMRYRKSIPKELMQEEGTFSWYQRWNGKIRPVNRIVSYNGREMYVVDEISARRFTHNELAELKGLPEFNYNDYSNKSQMYAFISCESNSHIIKSIAINMKALLLLIREI